MQGCIFCRIIKNEISSFKVREDDKYLAFLTVQPIREGHTLVVPKNHTDYFFDLDETALGEITVFSRQVAGTLKKVFKPRSGKIAVIIAGMGVPHAHIHLIPMDSEEDITFANQKHATPEQLQVTLDKINKFVTL